MILAAWYPPTPAFLIPHISPLWIGGQSYKAGFVNDYFADIDPPGHSPLSSDMSAPTHTWCSQDVNRKKVQLTSIATAAPLQPLLPPAPLLQLRQPLGPQGAPSKGRRLPGRSPVRGGDLHSGEGTCRYGRRGEAGRRLPAHGSHLPAGHAPQLPRQHVLRFGRCKGEKWHGTDVGFRLLLSEVYYAIWGCEAVGGRSWESSGGWGGVGWGGGGWDEMGWWWGIRLSRPASQPA